MSSEQNPPRLTLTALTGLPEFQLADDLAASIISSAARSALIWSQKPVLVVAQKIISKIEGRVVVLASINPSDDARKLAQSLGKDPRLVELILQESRRIVRSENGVLITETHHGFTCANSGVDCSNAGGPGRAVLLPLDPDQSAENLRKKLRRLTGHDCGIIISDSFGRPWRLGQVNIAIGVAGLPAIDPQVGRNDRDGRPLAATAPAIADELAAAAGLLMSKSGAYPVIVIEGFDSKSQPQTAKALLRPATQDLFR